MTQYSRPTAGQPATLILSEAFQGDLVDLVNAWHRGELTKKQSRPRQNGTVMVVNDTGATLQQNSLVAVEKSVSVSDATIESWKRLPSSKAVPVVWHSNVGDVAVLQNGIVNGQVGPVATNACVPVNYTPGSGGYVFVDPADTTKGKEGTGGFGRILMKTGTTAIVDLRSPQNVWKVKLKDDSGSVRIAELLNLDGSQYAEAITIEDPNGDLSGLKKNRIVSVVLSGSKFYPIAAASFSCQDLCDCGLYGGNGCAPEDEPQCCENVTDNSCNYTNKAISGVRLVFDGPPEDVYTQENDSERHSSGDLCEWDVPFTKNGEPEIINGKVTRESLTNVWKVEVDGRTWNSGASAPGCDGDIVLTEATSGTGEMTVKSQGPCTLPTIVVCNETLQGTLYPRATISGVPDLVDLSYTAPIAYSSLGAWDAGCDGILYDRMVIKQPGRNGVFIGPAMIPSANPNEPAAFDTTPVCVAGSYIRELYLGPDLVCTTGDADCQYQVNWIWTTGPGGRLVFDCQLLVRSGTCAAPGASLQVEMFAPDCTAGTTWRERTGSGTGNAYYATSGGVQCFEPIQVDLDIVLL